VRVELLISALQEVLEEDGEDGVEGEAVLIEPQQHVLLVGRQMHEHGEAVLLRVADHDEVADQEVDALRVTHLGEVVGDALQDILELPLLAVTHRGVEGAVNVLLNLHEALVDRQCAFVVVVAFRLFNYKRLPFITEP
jgi:hypothetical protein